MRAGAAGLLVVGATLTACIEPVSLFSTDSDGGGTDGGAKDGGSSPDGGDAGPPDSGEPSRGVTDVSAGWFHTCAVRAGALFCWGENSEGALGLGDVQPRLVPTRVGSGANWQQVSAGYAHTCARTNAGEVWCWGANDVNQLGIGDGPGQLTPQRVNLAAPAAQLSSRYDHSCAVLSDSSLWCWGENTEGQLGLDDTAPGSNAPMPVRVGTAAWRQVSCGNGHTCGVQTDNTLWCWGRNNGAQLGLGSSSSGQIRRPTRVGTASNWNTVAAGDATSCVLAGAAMWCWGRRLGIAAVTVDPSPVLVATPMPPAEVEVETFGARVRSTSGALACWGRNAEGQLGTGDVVDRAEPTAIAGTSWAKGALGRFHQCAIDSQGVLYCTGEGAQGRLGLGDTARRRVLTPVSFP